MAAIKIHIIGFNLKGCGNTNNFNCFWSKQGLKSLLLCYCVELNVMEMKNNSGYMSLFCTIYTRKSLVVGFVNKVVSHTALSTHGFVNKMVSGSAVSGTAAPEGFFLNRNL